MPPSSNDLESVVAFACRKAVESLGEAVSESEFADRPIADTGLDSLELLELVQEIEAEYGIKIDETRLTGDLTLRELVSTAFPEAKPGP